MAIKSIHDSSIENISTISCSQISAIQQVPELLTKEFIYSEPDLDLPHEDKRTEGFKNNEIIDLGERLHTLQDSVNQYNPSLIWLIIDFVIGRWFKVWRLRRSLQQVITVVDQVAQKMRNAIAVNATESQISSKKKLTDAVIKEIKISLETPDDTQQPTQNPTYVKAAQKIMRYFTKALERLNQGKNVILPRYFHSTKDQSIHKIFKSRTLKQSPAPKGYGVFVSTNDEGRFYGDFTFGINEDTIKNTKAHYFHGLFGGNQGNHKPSLWICLKADVPIIPGSIGCIITTRVDQVSKVVSKYGFNFRSFEEGDDAELADNDVPVFSPLEGTIMRNYVDLLDDKRQLPEKWYYDRRDASFLYWNWSDLTDWDNIQQKVERNEPLTNAERSIRKRIVDKLKKEKLPHNLKHDQFRLKITPGNWKFN